MATEQPLPESSEAMASDLVEKHSSEREALRNLLAAYVNLKRKYELNFCRLFARLASPASTMTEVGKHLLVDRGPINVNCIISLMRLGIPNII